jgi:hypothetical protein
MLSPVASVVDCQYFPHILFVRADYWASLRGSKVDFEDD